MKPPTLRDVAEAAQVSPAAVSKVLHGAGQSIRVSPARAEHIRMIAEKLNYRPNLLARNLRKSKTHTVGVLFENLTGLNDGPQYVSNLLDGVSSVLFKNHYRLTLLSEVDHHDIVGSLGDGQLDGVIWCKLARNEEIRRLIRATPIPIVAFNAAKPETDSKAICVNCDNPGGIKLAVEHLWNLGHRRIVFANESEEASTPDCVARRAAFVDAIREVGGEPGYVEEDWAFEGVPAKLVSEGITGVICWSESLAGRFLVRASETGVEVPKQISVVGFDSTQYCDSTTPRLTAVRQPIREMAAHATTILLEMIAEKQPNTRCVEFPCTFDIRESTARRSVPGLSSIGGVL
jgi:LacI family transcriptional regulator